MSSIGGLKREEAYTDAQGTFLKVQDQLSLMHRNVGRGRTGDLSKIMIFDVDLISQPFRPHLIEFNNRIALNDFLKKSLFCRLFVQ
ncbi:hypothetical protein BA171_07840 [Candidatus Hamiltonella defensa (Bemisia tabaci)]|uniref:Uncharacterized protein n=1 Tax=Candidatus Hamiltonella defensa (Bemisia tabaci) TaxID=672795 RepID=A0A249DZD4_9ENTR|nr:hypothetical protein BA171_07840 [Candidatus Hamiltonella defensa (Bemisia tabaci)]